MQRFSDIFVCMYRIFLMFVVLYTEIFCILRLPMQNFSVYGLMLIQNFSDFSRAHTEFFCASCFANTEVFCICIDMFQFGKNSLSSFTKSSLLSHFFSSVTSANKKYPS